MLTITTLAVGGLAVWRISHAIVKEDGPLMFLTRFRAYLARHQKRSGGLFDLVSCTMCTSVWVALVGSLWVAHGLFTWIAYSFAFSGVSLLLESTFVKKPDSLKIITPPATDNKVDVSRSATSE